METLRRFFFINCRLDTIIDTLKENNCEHT